MTPPAVRQSAEQRRETVLEAAMREFSKGGLDGTSTETIAERAGISQPYLFRLFPGKKALFIAAIGRCYSHLCQTFERATGDLTGQDAFAAMGNAYTELIQDRTFLLMQLQSYASCADPDVRTATRKGFRDVWYTIERLSGATPEEISTFYANGMLINIITAMDLSEVDERWALLTCTNTGLPVDR
ncbi:MAG TPA: TetR/AcrR family transcriptional regulator [Mycobacteriales bacterium]|nr:TetR/AcrR family transcriptional regulator [Mycobacteriales bacterium]